MPTFRTRIAVAAGAVALTVSAMGGMIPTPAYAAPTPQEAGPPVAIAATQNGFPMLRDGSNGSSVKVLQHLLNGHGGQLDIDGQFGPETDKSVRDFQTKSQIKADGVVGPDTWAKLLTPAREGSDGAVVSAVQEALNSYGGSLNVDGRYGPDTTAEVKEFQGKRGIGVDGIVGPETWSALLGGRAAEPGPAQRPGAPAKGPDTRYPKPKGRYPNGQVPANQLCQVPTTRNPAYKMSCRAVPDFVAMNAAYRRQFGRDLQVDHTTLTAYRTVPEQRLLYKKYGPGRAAKPGTSNHGWGQALDINVGGKGSATYKWLNRNGSKYGWNDPMSYEPWHWEYHR